MSFLVVGAGLSGAVMARELAEAGQRVVVCDERPHVAGNCHTERDDETGVMVHRYGPHLLHTSDTVVVDYLGRFGDWEPNQHRVKTTSASGIYSMPLNLLSMNQFFGTKLGPTEMQHYISTQRDKSITNPSNFEEQALAMMGERLYVEFFRDYTVKQWGRDPVSIPASVLKRLPMRFDYNDRYFSDAYELLPRSGYTEVVVRILDHPLIEVHLERSVAPNDRLGCDHVVWTGPIDAFFEYRYGRLEYRTLDFDWERGTFPTVGCSVMNYADLSTECTRVTEHNYFSPWEHHAASVLARETSRACEPSDIPYYPVRLAQTDEVLTRYLAEAGQLGGVTFAGRLGTYRYLDMDDAIAEALHTANAMLSDWRNESALAPFYVDVEI